MNKLIILAAASTVLAFTTPAFAGANDPHCDSENGTWMTKEDAKAKAKTMGYDSRKVKTENGCYELYTTDKDGAKMEVFMHPVSGKIVGIKKKS